MLACKLKQLNLVILSFFTVLCFVVASNSYAKEQDAVRINMRMQNISKKLRCTVCDNMSLFDSTGPMALSIKNQILQELNLGYTDKHIISNMHERYGDHILYRPPVRFDTSVLWFAPLAFLGIIFYVMYRNTRLR